MSIFLNSTGAALEVVTTTTQVLHCSVDAVDLPNGGTTVSPVTPQNTIISSAATTSIAGSPAAATSRSCQAVSILNTDAAAATITVKRTDGSVVTNTKTLTLPSGYSYHYESKRGWYIADSAGNEVIDQTQGPGQYVTTQRVSTGTTITLGTRTNKIRYRMWAAGGQGGGAPATAGANGGGGGAGSYAEGEATAGITPSAVLTCSLGAGGSTSGTGATGQVGGNTTLIVNSVTITCNGGAGGVAATTVAGALGGLGGAAGANGTLNIPGAAGEGSVGGTAADTRSGSGASTLVGAGGNAILETTNATGNAATGFGSGGGGASSTGTARAGGAGAGGLIIIDEYTG
jgi:hypothetical protein